MPIFFQHSINDSTQLAIWKIEEKEDFFLEKVPLRQQVSHPYKRLQHLAGRYLLPTLFSDFPLEEIRVADTRRPFLQDEKYHFSISHCGNFAAAIASSVQRVGVDVEMVTPRLLPVSKKFLSERELTQIEEWKAFPKIYLELVTMLWSAKESLYKWYGDGQLDFRVNMQVDGPIVYDATNRMTIPFLFRKNDLSLKVDIHAQRMHSLVLAWLAT